MCSYPPCTTPPTETRSADVRPALLPGDELVEPTWLHLCDDHAAMLDGRIDADPDFWRWALAASNVPGAG